MGDRSALTSAPCYRDPRAALKWLEAAFGFETVMLIETPDGQLVHSEMRFGEALLMVGYEWSDEYSSPLGLGGKVTQSINITIEDGLDAHCERARAAGAVILAEPQDQFYGDRTYRCRDPEGHIWTVSQTVRTVTREEAEVAGGGLKITGWI